MIFLSQGGRNYESKFIKVFVVLGLVFSTCFVATPNMNVYASDIMPYANESEGGGASAIVSSGSKSYSTASLTNAYFTIKSTSTESSYLNMTITVKNGSIKYASTGTTLINANGTSTSVTVTKKIAGTQKSFVFVPYNTSVSGYTITSLSAS